MITYVFSKETWVQHLASYVRTQVFILEQGISPQEEFDHYDTPQRYFLLALDKGKPVGTIRYEETDATTLKPDRLCVLAPYRKKGIGMALLTQLEEIGKEQGYQKSCLSAEVIAIPFYEKLGYHVASSPFKEDGILCVTMIKNLHP